MDHTEDGAIASTRVPVLAAPKTVPLEPISRLPASRQRLFAGGLLGVAVFAAAVQTSLPLGAAAAVATGLAVGTGSGTVAGPVLLAGMMLWAAIVGHLGVSAALLMFAVWATVSSRASVKGNEMNDLHRHLSWSRRRGEQAAVLVCVMPRRRGNNPASLASSFRITDSVAVHRRGSTFELHAVLDDLDLDREALERRILGAIDDVRIGWATFPHDGVALPALVDQARARGGVQPPSKQAVEQRGIDAQHEAERETTSRRRVLMKRRPELLSVGRGR